MAQAAGHDINYIALAGVLHAIGRKGEAPVPPLNLVGDFGGGGMFLAFGVVCALLEAQKSGKGQVVDAAMVDGAAYLAGGDLRPLLAGLRGPTSAASTSIDSGAPWYDVYKTKDGKWLSVGAIEKRFYAELVEKLGLTLGRAAQAARSQGLARAAGALRRGHRLAHARRMGARLRRAATPASRRCWRSARSSAIRTTWRAPPSCGATACCSRAPRRATPARNARWARRGRPRGVDSEAVLEDWGFAPAEIAELKKAGVVGAA